MYVFATSVQFPVTFLCILDDNVMFMMTIRGFFVTVHEIKNIQNKIVPFVPLLNFALFFPL